MASIVVSFVGTQDPGSDKTKEDGSILSLVRHLLAQNFTITRVILLYTSTDEITPLANLTKEWLGEELQISGEIVDLIPVDKALADDPVDLLGAVQAARQGMERAKSYLTPTDQLEFNASSGTPVMKSAWSILQAAGYAPASRVWQVRNPVKVKSGQERVFTTNVDTLKNEFDLKVVQQQIRDYNYSGALATLKETKLSTNIITALLESGHHRLAFDFNRADASIQSIRSELNDDRWIKEIAALRRKEQGAILAELYFKAVIKLKNQEYADFLVQVVAFQENALRILIQRKFLPEVKKGWKECEEIIKQAINTFDDGKLYQYLKNYCVEENGWSLRLEQQYIHRLTMIAILEYFSEFSSLVQPIKFLGGYCKQRNDSVHQLEGVSEIENQEEVLANLRKIVRGITKLPATNPFDDLNQKICDLLEDCLHS